MTGVKIYPVSEILDLCYGHKYGWLSKLLEVSDTVVLRPERKVGSAFRRNLSIKQYLVEECGISREEVNRLKIMFDHGIFVSSNEFQRIFGIHKTPRTLVEIYDALKVDYGLAYDVPSRLQLENAVRIATSKIIGAPIDDKTIGTIHPSIRGNIEKLVESILSNINLPKNPTPQTVSREIHKLIQKPPTTLQTELYNLSEATVKETLRNLEEQLKHKSAHSLNTFKLIPVVQGLYVEHSKECLSNIIDLLINYNESIVEDNKTYLYIAVGSGGRTLTSREAKTINEVMRFGYEYGRKHGVYVRFHLLGWSNYKIAEELELKLIYSSDSLTPRRRASEGKVYVLNSNRIKPINVSKINPETWSCQCPVCRDNTLRTYVLDPSGKRRNDARMVHNLWVVINYTSKNI